MSEPTPDDIASTTHSWAVDALGSSTPPPGFVSQGLWSDTSNTATAATENGAASATGGPLRQERTRNERTSSFNNIAQALGNGLAESMEDATRGEHTSHHGANHNLDPLDPTNLSADFFNPSKNNDMTYERHKRHAASRLLGAAGTSGSAPISHKAPEAGSLFGALDSANNDSNDHSSSRNDLTNNNNNNVIKNQSAVGGARRPVGMEGSSPTVSLPFAHDPTVAAFHPAYDTTGAMSSSLQFNGNTQSKNARDIAENGKSRLPVTKDLGMTVMEPSDSSYGIAGGGGSAIPPHSFSQYGSTNTRIGKADADISYGIQAGMQNLNMWSKSGGGGGGRGGAGGRSLNPPSVSPSRAVDRNGVGVAAAAAAGLGDHLGSPQTIDTEEELRPFTWDTNHHEPSRALAIFNATSIPPNEIISFCEKFGVVDNFRPEFLDQLGMVFISFFDMRIAQFSAMQLPSMLQRQGGGGGRVQVKFCVPLNSSSQNDESLVVINDLPIQIGADTLGGILSSFGAIRSLKNLGGGNYVESFVAEFHDVQDARKVVFELESSQPWGPDVSIEVGGRNSADRKKGRELLALLGRWRNQGGGRQPGRPAVNRGRPAGKSPDAYRPQADSRSMTHRQDGRYERGYSHEDQNQHVGYGQGVQDGRYAYGGNTYVTHQQHTGYPQYRGGPHHPSDNASHGSHGHHGNYMNRQVNHQPPPHQQQFYQQPQQMSHGNFPGGGSVMSGGSSRHTGTSPGYYTDDRSIGSHNSNLRSVNSLVDSMAGNTRDGQSQHLVLDLDAVQNGLDTRTTLMVRNIPNKYTQQMLLTEFTENNHGPGVIDFFYLPIDFKNRCNRGYAFINFVDHHDILNFHRQYYGKHWRTFNSDKICDITYARIQGKAAMLKRFENSALMERDEEYKPLVFVSSGPERGERLPFPDSSRGS
jgi:hypothetical protein